MNFAHGAFAQLIKDAGKPRSRLWGFVLFTIACIVFYGHRAIVENDTAKRQQTSFGTTTNVNGAARDMKTGVTTRSPLATIGTEVSAKHTLK